MLEVTLGRHAIVEESTLTERYQTTIPATVRRALGLGKHGKIRYVVQSDGQVLIRRADTDGDEVLGAFMRFLARDLADHPERLQAVDGPLRERLEALVDGVDIELESPLLDEEE